MTDSPRDTEAAEVARIASAIDHTVLAPTATPADIMRACDEALAHGFFGVCVASAHIRRVAEALVGSPVRAISTVGFPHGNAATAVKTKEAALSLAAGAAELDMVLSLGALKAGDHVAVRQDIAAVVALCGSTAYVKVILETACLSDPEKVLACRLAVDAGAAFVKTSTGFASAGATEADVALMRRTVGTAVGVKASGGIRTAAAARALLASGASRLGCSQSVAIVRELGRSDPG